MTDNEERNLSELSEANGIEFTYMCTFSDKVTEYIQYRHVFGRF